MFNVLFRTFPKHLLFIVAWGYLSPLNPSVKVSLEACLAGGLQALLYGVPAEADAPPGKEFSFVGSMPWAGVGGGRLTRRSAEIVFYGAEYAR